MFCLPFITSRPSKNSPEANIKYKPCQLTCCVVVFDAAVISDVGGLGF